ncbi:MAG: hypothetical protein ACREAB_02260 [Blastocatellia bacterium]
MAEASSLTLSIVTAELFYKFHSFTLECLAFLATWYAVSYLASRVGHIRSASSSSET